MEPNGTNQNRAPTVVMCRMGCGFYGSSACDGMCSKCYKDCVKSHGDGNVSTTDKPTNDASSTKSSRENTSQSQRARDGHDSAEDLATMALVSLSKDAAVVAGIRSRVERDLREVGDGCEAVPVDGMAAMSLTGPRRNESSSCNLSSLASSAGSSTSDLSDASGGKAKKPRCDKCSKKVGLTGWPCRCGGLYCSMHRYSDKHECTFDYKAHGKEELRRKNMKCVGEKVQQL